MKKSTKTVLALATGYGIFKASGRSFYVYYRTDEFGKFKTCGISTTKRLNMDDLAMREFVENNMLFDSTVMTDKEMDRYFADRYDHIHLENKTYLLKSKSGDHEILLTKNLRGKYSPFLIDIYK